MTTNLVKFLPCLPEPFVQIPAAFLHQFLNHQTALLQVRSVQPLLLFQIGAVGPLVLLHFPFLHAHFLLLQHTITHNGHSASYILVSQYYVLVSPMASFPQASPPTPCVPLYPPPYAPHSLPISFVSILAASLHRTHISSINCRGCPVSKPARLAGQLLTRLWITALLRMGRQ